MSWSGWNLPPGCFQRDIDRAYGYDEPDDEYEHPCGCIEQRDGPMVLCDEHARQAFDKEGVEEEPEP